MNNLRIDLILPTERRSSSPIRVRFILNIVGAIVACVVIIGAVKFGVKVQAAKRGMASTQEAVERSQKPLTKARNAVKERDRVKKVLDQFKAWNNARLPYRDFLVELQNIVPGQVQLKTMDFSDSFSPNSLACKIDVTGLAQGPDPKGDVDTLVLNLQTSASLTGIVAKASVVPGSFKPAGTTGEDRNYRVFQLALELRPKQF